MKIAKKLTLILSLAAATTLGYAASARAQNLGSDWANCPDDSGEIVRCATYNCPKGDTNGDGTCTIADEDAKLTDLRNDALCSNPPSSCGQVYYYNSDGKACADRIKETDTCEIGEEQNPIFGNSDEGDELTPTPTMTPTSTPTPTISETKGGKEATDEPETLPKTGPATTSLIFLALSAGSGLYIYTKNK